MLIHWGRMMHICVIKLTIIGSDNGLSPGRRQAIIWTSARISLIGPWGTNLSEFLISLQTFSYKKMHLKMLSVKWQPSCLVLNVLRHVHVFNSIPLGDLFCGWLFIIPSWLVTNVQLADCQGPFYYNSLPSISIWISNYIHYEVWNEITYSSKTSTDAMYKQFHPTFYWA